MHSLKKLVDALELELELMELKELGLTDEEIVGFIEVFYDSWVMPEDMIMN